MINKEKYIDLIKKEFTQKKILVIGDLMVDEYVTGKVKRISPEAPVPVLDYGEKRLEAGGACNVAHNLNALGARVMLAGVANNDNAGLWLREHFQKMHVDVEGVVEEADRPTTVKTRYAVKGQQLLRVDNEVSKTISKQTEIQLIEFLDKNIGSLDAVVISDYKKGVLGDASFVEKVIDICNSNEVLVSVDSKSRDIFAFKNADFVKPNNLELEEAVGITIEDNETLNAAGNLYLRKSGAKALVVTRGPRGISVFEPNTQRSDYPAKDVQVFDVCGAGDTVISTITIGMCCGLPLGEAVMLANLAAGVVISCVGTVAIKRDDLIRSVNEE